MGLIAADLILNFQGKLVQDAPDGFDHQLCDVIGVIDAEVEKVLPQRSFVVP